jgi:SAM-dependent methyltransferase
VSLTVAGATESARRSRLGATLTRLLNPRYSWLPRRFLARPLRILDAGCGATDATIAKRIVPECRFEGVNLVELPAESKERAAFDAYHVLDLDDVAAAGSLPDESFDYVVSSHTLEHLRDGLAVARALSAKVRPGGLLYFEWPSPHSERFPLRGFGLNFFDDPTHRQTYSIEEMVSVVTGAGFDVLYAGRRRQALRMLLAPALVIYRSIKLRRPVLYDLWDFTGFCCVLRAVRQPAGDKAS